MEDINVTSAEGYTAVHLAAASGQAAVISRLKAQGVNLSLQSRDGSIALHLVVRNKHLSAIKVLLELGATSSLDAFAKSPRMYASALSGDDMIQLLDQHLSLDAQSSSVNFNSVKGLIYLAQSLEDAIVNDDLEECKRLRHVGCSLDTSMSSCHGCSSLIKAISCERLHIAEWLMKCKATTLKAVCHHHHGLGGVELAMTFASLNPMLKQLLTRYIEEGGDILSDGLSPLEWAIRSHNDEGLKIFLDLVSEMAERIR